MIPIVGTTSDVNLSVDDNTLSAVTSLSNTAMAIVGMVVLSIIVLVVIK
jgi:hypothetical protein